MLKDVGQLQTKKSAQLRDLGRFPYPMIRQRGEKGFNRVSWDEALEVIASKIRATTSDRLQQLAIVHCGTGIIQRSPLYPHSKTLK